MQEFIGDPQQYIDMAVQFGIRTVVAILVLILGFWLIRKISKSVDRMLTKRHMEEALRKFLRALLTALLQIALVITVISQLGVQTTSFVALLGAAGLAVGMALSGTLQNFAGGVMILLFKPFRIGDYISAQGHEGAVQEILIFNTILLSVDNKRIILANGGVASSTIVNYTAEDTRRVDWTFGIGYGDDVAVAQRVMRAMLDADDRVLKDPEVFVEVATLADSSVNFAVRAWVKTEDYWGVYFDMNRKVYEGFEKEGLNIPYPQMDVHVHRS